MASNNGIELPVSLLLKNLGDVANLIKLFANKNILADSLGGKRVNSELDKILARLDLISAKSKTAFTTLGDFNSVQKDINSVELSLNKVQDTIRNLGFSDLKIPEEFSGQIAALLGRIKELNNSLTAFKGTLKEKLVNNADFLTDLLAADPSRAAKMLEKGYDELYKAVNKGMSAVNAELTIKVAEYQRQLSILTQNTTGKTAMTLWGALSFLLEAFKLLPTDSSKLTELLKLMSNFMNTAANEAGGVDFTTFKNGNAGYSSFLKHLRESFEFTPEQLSEIRLRIKTLAAELKKSASEIIKNMGTDSTLAKNILFGTNLANIEEQIALYKEQLKAVDKALTALQEAKTRLASYLKVSRAFDLPNKEILLKAEEIAAALKVPQDALRGFEESILSAATKSPELAALFQNATGEIATLTNTVEQGKQKLLSIDNTINKMQGISNFINRYVGLYAIVRKVTTAIRNAFNNIKELDKAITGIAVVTNMSQLDLWGKIGEYTLMAQQYGVATKDVYEVSQIFYQQGLQTSLVMSMTTESLKMAKIAGIDYTTAANAMTVAVRAFKLEMTEAQSVTDTYSALAAKFAVSSSEIANAMEKTASSAASVGMSLQSTSAFISVMEQTTRESAQNIGSALKSIISRYGEMKASPDKLLNVEGEEVAFNKVDTALASIGISIKDASGQFRDFDDVIMELAAKWNTLDNNTQRYIATIMAGNRQQSRFIALVSNYDELSRAMNVANNAENASIVQVAKTMDSLESKANLVKNAFSLLYLDLHIEEGLKGAYDWLTRILRTIGKLGTVFGALPTLANIIGFGTGAKSLVSSGMNWLLEKKGKLQVQTEEALQKVDEIRAKASLDINTKWKIQADTSLLLIALTLIQTLTDQAAMNASNALLAMLPGKFTEELMLGALSRALSSQMLATPEGRALFMKTWGGIEDPESKLGLAIDALLLKLSALGQISETTGLQLKQLEQSAARVTLADEKKVVAGEAAARADQLEAISSDIATLSDLNEANSSSSSAVQIALANYDAALAARNDALAKVDDARATHVHGSAAILAARDVLFKAEKDRVAALAALDKARADEEGARSEHEDANANREDALTERENANANRDNSKSKALSGGGGWSGHETAMKVTGLLTGVARMIGTAVTAFGASLQDKSSDKNEASKIWTGIGNGISMAGTGASMGMAFGPWGALAGGIIGLIGGGFGAVIDGISMTISERIDLLKQELDTIKDNSLKELAKVLDLESSIDNISALKKVMYDSEEGMLSYKDAINNLTELYPSLIKSYDELGNAILDLNAAETALATARLTGALAAEDAAKKEAEYLSNIAMGYESGKASAKFVLENNLNKNNTDKVDISSIATVLSEYSNIYGGKNAWLLLYGTSTDKSGNSMTIEEVLKLYDILDGLTTKALSASIALDELAGLSVTRTSLFNAANNSSISSSLKNELEKNNIYSLIFNLMIGNKFGGSNLGIYYASKYQPELLNTELESTAALFIQWYLNGLTLMQRDILESIDFTLYKSIDEILQQSGITLDLNNEFENNIYQALLKQFNNTNIGEKDRLRLIIYGTTDIGLYMNNHKLNSDLTGLVSLNREDEIYEIVQSFDTNNIISLYADMFSHELVAINKLAELHLTAAALSRLTNLVNFSNTLLLYDSGVLSALLSIINGIEFNSYDSIMSAIDSIKTYGKNNGIDVSNLITVLLNSISNLSFNVNTLAENVMSNISTFAEEFDKIISNNKNGLDSASALKEFNSLLVTLKNGNELLFDLIYTYDAVLGKYVYTSNGLSLIIAAREELLNQDITLLTTKAERYTKEISPTVKNVKDLSTNATIYNAENKDILYNLIDTNIGAYIGDTSIYKVLADLFILLYGNTEKATWESFLEFVQEDQSNLSTLSLTTDNNIKFESDVDIKKLLFEELLGSYFENKKYYDYLAENFMQNESSLYLDKNLETFLLYLEDSNTEISSVINEIEDTEDIEFDINTPQLLYDKMSLTFSNYNENATIYLELAGKFLSDTSDKYSEKTWSNFLLYIEELSTLVEQKLNLALNELQVLNNNKKNQYYQAIDWSKLALGTDFSGANENYKLSLVKELNKTRGVEDLIDESADWEFVLDIYLELLYLGMENANQLILDAKARIKSQISTSKSTQATTAISEILAGEGKKLSEETLSLIKEWDSAGNVFTISDTGELESATEESLNYVKAALIIYKDRVSKGIFETVEELNQSYIAILNKSFEKANIGKTLLSSGNKLDLSTLENSFNALGLLLSDFYVTDADGKNGLWQGSFANALDTDIFGQTTITNWDNFVAALKEKGIEIGDETSAEYQKWYRAYIDAKISDAESTDPKRIAATLISNLGNAKVGDTLNITNIKDILKLPVDEIYISTLEQLDGYIELLELQLLDNDWVTNNALAAELARSIVSKFKTKDNKFESLKGVIAELVSYGAAETYASAMGYTGDVTTYMLEQLGYYWDDYSKLFKVGSNSIEKIQSKIDELTNDVDAEGNKIDHSEEIAILTGMLKDLKDLTGNKATNALRDILTNYTNITNTMVETFETQFANIDLDQFIHEVNGRKELDIAALRQAYPEIAALIDTSMQEEIAAIIDDNLAEIENATNLIASGTTSLKDMATFVTKYNNDMRTNLSLGDLFSYDDILDSFTLKPEYLLTYILKLREELEKLGWKPEDIDKFIEDTTVKLLASAIDIDSFLEATNRSEGSKSREKLIKQFENLRKSLINTSDLPDYAKKSALDSTKLYAKIMVDAIEAGGESAVNAGKELATLLEEELSPEEIEKYYYSAINRLQGYADSIGDLTEGSYVADEGLREILKTAGMIDAETGLVTNVLDMAKAYYEIYSQMSETAGNTKASLNKIYAQYLTTSELGDIDAIAAMSDAMGMTYETLGEILGKSGESLQEWLKENTSMYEHIGAGKIRITDFASFADLRGWKPGTEEYTRGFKAYNDSLIELDRKTEKAIVEEVKSISEAKGGSRVNVTLLATKLGIETNKIVLLTGATILNGILKIEEGADIPTVIAQLRDLAELSAALIPEEMAELEDTILDLLSEITSLIEDGITGGLKHTEAQKLNNWYRDALLQAGVSQENLLNLLFTRTKDGLKLVNGEAEKLYRTMKNVDTLQSEIIFDTLKDNAIETDDRFKSASSNAAYIRLLLTLGFTAELNLVLAGLNGNVDLFNRPVIQNADGSITTIYAATEESLNYESKVPWVMNITPVTPDGKELSNIELQKYILELVDETGGNMDEMIKLDKEKLGLIIEGENTDLKLQEKIVQLYDTRAEKLHNISNLIEENKKKSAEELELAERINMARSTSEDSSFKFMENNIPAAQNNPLNYYENWGKAWKTLRDSFKSTTDKGMIEYQDFYNIITEMGNLVEKSGVPIELGAGKFITSAESAAKYIEEGAAALTVASDGSIKVDLTKFGMDFSGGADKMAEGVDAGIKEIAKSQVKMLDGLIQMMEAIVAIEKFKDIDLDNKGVLDLGEIFLIEIDENGVLSIVGWQLNFKDIATTILKTAKDNKELTEGLDNILINNKSLHLLLQDAVDGADIATEDAEAYLVALNALYLAALSGEYNLNNIMASIEEVLAGTDFNGEIQIGDTVLTFRRKLTVIKVDNGQYKGEHTKETYNNPDAAAAAEALVNEGAKEEDIHPEGTDYVSTIVFDSLTFKVKVDKDGNITYTDADGKGSYTRNEAIAKAYQLYEATAKENNEEPKTFEEWLVLIFGKFTAGEITIEDANKFAARTHELVQALAEALANGNGDDVVDVAKEIGINVELTNGVLTEEQRKQLTEITGIEDKIITVSVVGDKAKESAEEILSKLKLIEESLTIIDFEVHDYEAKNAIDTIRLMLENLDGNTAHTEVYTTTYNRVLTSDENGVFGAKGTIGLAKAKGTLMGELGPELVVQGSKYFVAGQYGPEMVDLADDAIVFNHLQTKSLLEKGTSSGRGRAITNERNAVAFSKGNINGGPAMASASSALTALKLLRAQWQALLGLSAKDLAGKGGGGGGGNKNDPKVFVKDLEIWYNWLQRIAVLELKITYEQLKRSKILSDMIAHGQDYAKSLMETLDYLRELAVINQSLVNAQQKYFDKRRAEMNSANNPFSALYTFDEYGQLKYKKGALQKLSLISGRNELTGEANYTALQQYSILSLMGYAKYMEYDSSGNKIDKSLDDWYVSAVQAFWDKIDADLKEMQDLHDSIEEHKKAVLEAQEQANLIMHEIEENLISLEDKVLKAIISTREREIEELQKERDAIEEASLNLIDGLSELLNKEKDMYQRQGELDELAKLQRQLSILQRSGGSASQIANLLREINQKLLDMYFETQQAQIDALQQASDNQLLRLDAQIDLMKETLEYEKDNGLLWALVYDVLSGTPEQITAFILEHDDEFWGKSPTTDTKNYREALFEALQFKEYQKLMKDGLDGIVRAFTDDAIKKAAKAEEAKLKALTGGNGNVPTPAGGTNPTNDGGNGGGNPSDKPKKKVYREKAILTYINTDYGMKISEGIGESSVSAEEAKKNALADARKKAKNLRDTVSTKYTSFSTGGMVDKTGPAIVHAKESVLTAEQTSILRNDILSNKPTSLLSLLTDFRDAYNGISNANYNSITQNDGVTIEQAVVEMHVSKIANDYDAQRAGELALEKMVSIARKTQGQRIGR